MSFSFRIVEKENIKCVVPLVKKLNGNRISDKVLEQRFVEMSSQNYECAGVYDDDILIGVAGLWYCTRHYSGRSVEPDHVYIEESYRNKGLGNLFFKWITNYVKEKGYETIELNAYVRCQR